MRTVNEIYEYLCDLAPLDLQLDFDNAGIQLGRLSAKLEKAILALDITDEVIDEAIESGSQLLISHHPLIWNGLKEITDSLDGAKLLKLAENKIAAISMHTNLDIVNGGVNDLLLELLGAQCEAPLDEDNCGRVGDLIQPVSMPEFLKSCKAKLKANGLRYHDAGRSVKKLAVMGGAGGDALLAAYRKGCDTYLTSDIKYHQFLMAKELGINLIDADHFCTENPVVYMLREKLSAQFPDVCFAVSERHQQPVSFA